MSETVTTDQPILDLNFGQTTTEPIHNQEIANMLDYLDDALRQLTACPSASERNWLQADLDIARDIHGRLASMISEYNAEPQLYLPNANRTAMTIAPPPVLKQPENVGILKLARHLARFRTQLVNGVSAKQVSGFHPGEYEKVIEPMRAKYDSYLVTEEERFSSGAYDYFPEVQDQEPTETTPGSPI